MRHQVFFTLLLVGSSLLTSFLSEAQPLPCGSFNYMIDHEGNCINLDRNSINPSQNTINTSSRVNGSNLLELAQQYGIPATYPARGRYKSPDIILFQSEKEGRYTNKFFIDLGSISRSDEIVQWDNYSEFVNYEGEIKESFDVEEFTNPSGSYNLYFSMNRFSANCKTLEGTQLISGKYHNFDNLDISLQIESIKVIELSNRRTIEYPSNSPIGQKIEYVCNFSGYINN